MDCEDYMTDPNRCAGEAWRDKIENMTEDQLDELLRKEGIDPDEAVAIVDRAFKKAWERFRDNNEPIGQATLYYKDNREYWRKGFIAGASQSLHLQNAAAEMARAEGRLEALSEIYDAIENKAWYPLYSKAWHEAKAYKDAPEPKEK